MAHYRVAIPAGIGDFSWLWSKLSTIKDATWEFFVPDAFPYRTKQYVDLLPNCKGGLGQHKYSDILIWGGQHGYLTGTWEQIVKSYPPDDFIYIEANKHLEAGKPLKDFLPDLDTDFHYPIPFQSNFKLPEGKILGIHMASIKGVRNWNAWMPETWAEFLKLFYRDFPGWQVVALGGSWDVDMVMELNSLLPNNFPLQDYVGRTSIHDVIKILTEIDYYVGYSSGLNCIRNVLGKPCTTLWPKHQRELMYSHVDPNMALTRDYVGFVYDTPERIFNRVKSIIKEKEKCQIAETAEVSKS